MAVGVSAAAMVIGRADNADHGRKITLRLLVFIASSPGWRLFQGATARRPARSVTAIGPWSFALVLACEVARRTRSWGSAVRALCHQDPSARHVLVGPKVTPPQQRAQARRPALDAPARSVGYLLAYDDRPHVRLGSRQLRGIRTAGDRPQLRHSVGGVEQAQP